MHSKSTQLNSDPDNEKEQFLRKIRSSIKFAFLTNSSLILLCTNILIKKVVTSEIANERTPYRLQHNNNNNNNNINNNNNYYYYYYYYYYNSYRFGCARFNPHFCFCSAMFDKTGLHGISCKESCASTNTPRSIKWYHLQSGKRSAISVRKGASWSITVGRRPKTWRSHSHTIDLRQAACMGYYSRRHVCRYVPW